MSRAAHESIDVDSIPAKALQAEVSVRINEEKIFVAHFLICNFECNFDANLQSPKDYLFTMEPTAEQTERFTSEVIKILLRRHRSKTLSSLVIFGKLDEEGNILHAVEDYNHLVVDVHAKKLLKQIISRTARRTGAFIVAVISKCYAAKIDYSDPAEIPTAILTHPEKQVAYTILLETKTKHCFYSFYPDGNNLEVGEATEWHNIDQEFPENVVPDMEVQKFFQR